MKIENLTRIMGAKLLNSPYVSSIEGISFDIEKIERGNLFVDLQADSNTHEIATKKGAYAILTPLVPKISDKEIAWLHVEDIDLSLIKVARFFASTKELNFILVNKVQYELIKCLHLNFQTCLLSNSISNAVLDIFRAKEKTLFFVEDDAFIEKIAPMYKAIDAIIQPEKIFSRGLFYSSFVLNETFYSDIKLPSFLVPYLCAIQNFFEKESIEYKIDNFSSFRHFHPVFVNKLLEKKDFGSSEKVIIYENDSVLFKEAVDYVLEKMAKEKLTLLLPKKFLDSFPKEIQKYSYKDKDDLIKLMNNPFHYVLVLDEFHTFETPSGLKPKQMNLF